MSMLQRLFSTLTLLTLAACGGGGGSSGTTPFGAGAGAGTGTGTGSGGTTSSPTITVAISPSTVTATTPGSVTAKVTSGTGAGIAGQVVQFTTQSGLGVFSATSALTDANGLTSPVSIKPTSASSAGADVVVATTNVGGTPITGSQGFQLTATNVSISTFTSDIPGTTALAPYGQSALTVVLSAAAQGTPVSVSLSSTCVTAGQATLTPNAVTTTTGTATFTYRDNGCGAAGSDTVLASVTGSSSTASLRLLLTSPAVSSISFVSASPSTIFLRSSGYVENSTVTFQVRDAAGNGIRGQAVQIDPTTLAGGLQVNGASSASQFPLSTLSDSNGNVIVRVNSGTVPTPVRIRASITLPGGAVISTVSSTLAIAVGLPSELNFSLSQNRINIEGMNRDGTLNSYTVIASDRLGNPVPDGTAINFVSEAGQVQSIIFTAANNGLSSATAQFQSSQPRPPDGRVTVLAYALGEKSFIDENGDNVFTAADTHQWFQDLGYPYLDTLFNGQYASSPLNQYIVQAPDGSSACNASMTAALQPSLLLDVSIPSRPGTCTGSWGSGYVRRAAETIFSTSATAPSWGESWPSRSGQPTAALVGTACPSRTLIPPNVGSTFPAYSSAGVPSQRSYYPVQNTALYGLPAAGAFSFFVSDANAVAFNPVAAGSTISVAATTGLTAALLGGSPVASSSAPTSATVSFSFDSTSSGTVTINVTSPSGLTTSTAVFVTTSSTLPAGYTSCP